MKPFPLWVWGLLASFFFLISPAEGAPLSLWHAWRGKEADALKEAVAVWNQQHPESPVLPQALPYEVLSSKLEAAIPRGNGPDLFIYAHEKVGAWRDLGLLAEVPPQPGEDFLPLLDQALYQGGSRFGLPLAGKSLLLFRDPGKIPKAPETTEELLRMASHFHHSEKGEYGLGWLESDFYFHAPLLHGFGGTVFGEDGSLTVGGEAFTRSLSWIREVAVTRGLIPPEPTSALLTQLFNEGKLAFLVNGPWFLGEVAPGVPFAVSPLPRLTETRLPLRPFLTVEALYVSARTPSPGAAGAFAAWLAGFPGAVIRGEMGNQTVAHLSAAREVEIRHPDPVRRAFQEQAENALPTPVRAEMTAVWEPANQALRQVIRGDLEPDQAARTAQRRIELTLLPDPPHRSPTAALVLASLLTLLGAVWMVGRVGKADTRRLILASLPAYAWIAPSLVGLFLLSLLPFLVGTMVSLFAGRNGEFTYVGLANFARILASPDYDLWDPMNFWYTALVTIAWTGCNVALHVGIGLFLALLLRDPWVKMRTVYRVLLILPWAVPNYITALLWKGMFHRQFGAINALLVALGAEPISWFSRFSTAFAANVATNTWLGFPFMMVVILGALQAVPRELEEAAELDGASSLQRFRHITLPLLLPSLLPAVVLGSVWTFNQFNIIYLVSEGEPDGATDILISQAYKWAFERQSQYGYAAAYATLIFLLLLGWSRLSQRLLREEPR